MRNWLALLILPYFSAVYAQDAPLLAALEVKLESNQTLPLSNKVSFELASSNATSIAQSLQDWQNISVKKVDHNILMITMDSQPRFSGEVLNRYLADSFVIDINEQSTQKFIAGFTKSIKPTWSLKELVTYVNTYIDQPTYIHGFSIASVVAKNRSGDCTEYAVLTAALARAMALPARVIVGSVLLEGVQQVSAFGHAWTEVWQNGQWHILDAALYGSEAKQHFYLPAAALDNEGPGFTLSLAAATNLMPIKILRLRNAE